MIKDYWFWIIADMNLHKSPEVRLIPHRAPQKYLTCPQNTWMLMLSTETQAGREKPASLKGSALQLGLDSRKAGISCCH